MSVAAAQNSEAFRRQQVASAYRHVRLMLQRRGETVVTVVSEKDLCELSVRKQVEQFRLVTQQGTVVTCTFDDADVEASVLKQVKQRAGKRLIHVRVPAEWSEAGAVDKKEDGQRRRRSSHSADDMDESFAREAWSVEELTYDLLCTAGNVAAGDSTAVAFLPVARRAADEKESATARAQWAWIDKLGSDKLPKWQLSLPMAKYFAAQPGDIVVYTFPGEDESVARLFVRDDTLPKCLQRIPLPKNTTLRPIEAASR